MCMCAVYLVGGGLIIEANIPCARTRGSKRGGGLLKGLIFRRIRYNNTHAIDNYYTGCVCVNQSCKIKEALN